MDGQDGKKPIKVKDMDTIVYMILISDMILLIVLGFIVKALNTDIDEIKAKLDNIDDKLDIEQSISRNNVHRIKKEVDVLHEEVIFVPHHQRINKQ